MGETFFIVLVITVCALLCGVCPDAAFAGDFSVPSTISEQAQKHMALYTLAPEVQWREILGQTTAVVRALVAQGQDLRALAICGDSAGGALAAATVLKARDEGIGLPGAVVLWSPWADITSCGDTYATLQDADPVLRYTDIMDHCAAAYAAPEDQKNPYVSLGYADYTRGFPPTLIQAGTKEILLSDAVRQYRALA